jgi:4-oxalocrotonate tautomerase
MPFANLKVPAGSLTTDQKKDMVTTVTDMYVNVWGEEARAGVMVLIDEVPDGGWGIRGDVLTLAMLQGDGS